MISAMIIIALMTAALTRTLGFSKLEERLATTILLEQERRSYVTCFPQCLYVTLWQVPLSCSNAGAGVVARQEAPDVRTRYVLRCTIFL
jgi:hypothetical protein